MKSSSHTHTYTRVKRWNKLKWNILKHFVPLRGRSGSQPANLENVGRRPSLQSAQSDSNLRTGTCRACPSAQNQKPAAWAYRLWLMWSSSYIFKHRVYSCRSSAYLWTTTFTFKCTQMLLFIDKYVFQLAVNVSFLFLYQLVLAFPLLICTLQETQIQDDECVCVCVCR